MEQSFIKEVDNVNIDVMITDSFLGEPDYFAILQSKEDADLIKEFFSEGWTRQYPTVFRASYKEIILDKFIRYLKHNKFINSNDYKLLQSFDIKSSSDIVFFLREGLIDNSCFGLDNDVVEELSFESEAKEEIDNGGTAVLFVPKKLWENEGVPYFNDKFFFYLKESGLIPQHIYGVDNIYATKHKVDCVKTELEKLGFIHAKTLE